MDNSVQEKLHKNQKKVRVHDQTKAKEIVIQLRRSEGKDSPNKINLSRVQDESNLKLPKLKVPE